MRKPLLALLLCALAAPAMADILGGPGETCKSSNDCKLGLRCVREKCTDTREGSKCKSDVDCGGRACVKNECVSAMVATPTATASSTSASPEDGTAEGKSSVWSPMPLDRVHPYVGVTTLFGPAFGGRTDSRGRWDDGLQPSFLFAVRGGLLIDHHEIGFEVAPLTYVFYAKNLSAPQFEAQLTYGYLVPLIEKESFGLYYPLRGGVGVFFGNISQSVYFQASADVVGLAVRVGHFIAGLHAPSFRWGLYDGAAMGSTVGRTTMVFTWDSGLSLTYGFL